MGFADVYSFSNGRQRSSHVFDVFRLNGGGPSAVIY